MSKQSDSQHVVSTEAKLSAVREARSRLRLALTLFSLALLILLTLLLIRVYSDLEGETLNQYRIAAEEIADRIDQRVIAFLEPEENRPFGEYSFLNVSEGIFQDPESQTVTSKGLVLSPICGLPRNSKTPGLQGYFQINPDNSYHSPILPSSGLESLSESLKFFPPEEFEERQAVWRNVHQTLKKNEIESIQGPLADSRRNSPLLPVKRAAWSKRKVLVDLPVEKKASTVTPDLSGLPLHDLPDAPFIQHDDQSQFKTYEAEIDPFQMEILDDGHLVFLRKVWLNQKRYIQGFLLQQNIFLKKLIEPVLQGRSTFKEINVKVLHQDKIIANFRGARAAPTSENSIHTGLLLHQTYPIPPLDTFSLILTVDELPSSAGRKVVTQLVVALVLVLCWGIFVIYQLSISHLDLAQQRSDFVSAITHELKTPLTSIRMYGEMLRSGWVPDEEKRKSYYDFIFYESERLSRLIQNVLQLANLNKKGVSIQLEVRKVQEVFEHLLKAVRPQAEYNGFSVIEVIDESEIDAESLVQVDLDILTQIFVNLVDNALKFSKDSKKKVLELHARVAQEKKSLQNALVFSVRDFGPGVDPQQQALIFDLFYRGEDELTRATSGTGIGLALVKQLTESMGAIVRLVPHDDGSEFQIVFPGSEEDDTSIST